MREAILGRWTTTEFRAMSQLDEGREFRAKGKALWVERNMLKNSSGDFACRVRFLPALVMPLSASCKRPFFLSMKLEPIKMLELMASAKPP